MAVSQNFTLQSSNLIACNVLACAPSILFYYIDIIYLYFINFIYFILYYIILVQRIANAFVTSVGASEEKPTVQEDMMSSLQKQKDLYGLPNEEKLMEARQRRLKVSWCNYCYTHSMLAEIMEYLAV